MPAINTETTRRETLRILALLAACGLTREARAADAPGWPAEAFRQKTQDDAVRVLFGKTLTASDKVALDVPDIAENGAVVPVSVSTTLAGVTSISILVPENPFVLAATYTLAEGTLPAVASRLKMAKTSNVIAIVESGGTLYAASREVKVTLGGCGG